MPLRTFHLLPHKALQPYIDRLWGWETSADEVVALPTVLPGTGAELFFHYRTPFRRIAADRSVEPMSQMHLLCVRSAPVELVPSADIGFIAVRFRAGALHRFTGMPGGELIDTPCSAADIWGEQGKSLSARLGDAASKHQRATLLQSFLYERLMTRQSDPLVEAAVSLLYRDCAVLPIERLAEHMRIGRRQLERRFVAMTGQTPVEVRRVARFQKTVRTLLLDPSSNMADAALTQGYYDQAHFIRDFRTLVSTSPQRYLQAARMKTHFYNTPRQTP